MKSWKSLKEKQLPPIESFYDELNDNNITEKEYAHVQKVWKTFNIQTMQEYTEIYLKTDVLLLVDIFENFHQNCIKLYELDPRSLLHNGRLFLGLHVKVYVRMNMKFLKQRKMMFT